MASQSPLAANAQLFGSLRDWINQQEQLERESGTDSLTIDRKKLIGELLNSPAPKPEAASIEMDERNYIGELTELVAKKRYGDAPQFSEGEMLNTRLPNAPNNWSVTCTLPWCDQVFPQPGFGFEEGSEPPRFQSKKVARRYAAKQAIAFLLTNPDPESQTAASAGASSSSARKHRLDDTSSTTTISPPAKRIPLPKESDPRYQANRICARLKIHPPKYIVTLSDPENNPYTFNGRVTWPQSIIQPKEAIAIEGSAFRDQQEAEEYLARRALEWLQGEEKHRRATLEEAVASLGREQPLQIPGLGLPVN